MLIFLIIFNIILRTSLRRSWVMGSFWLSNTPGIPDGAAARFDKGEAWIGNKLNCGTVAVCYSDGYVWLGQVEGMWDSADARYEDGYMWLGHEKGSVDEAVASFFDTVWTDGETEYKEVYLVNNNYRNTYVVACSTLSEGGAAACTLLLLLQDQLEEYRNKQEGGEEDEEEVKVGGEKESSGAAGSAGAGVSASAYGPSSSAPAHSSTFRPSAPPTSSSQGGGEVFAYLFALLVVGGIALYHWFTGDARVQPEPDRQVSSESAPRYSPPVVTTPPVAPLPKPPESVMPEAPGPLSYMYREHETLVRLWMEENPGWEVAKPEDCRCDIELARFGRYFDNKHPYYAVGDFDYDGSVDFAVVVKSPSQKLSGIVVGDGNGDRRLHFWTIERAVEGRLLLYDEQYHALYFSSGVGGTGLRLVNGRDTHYAWKSFGRLICGSKNTNDIVGCPYRP